GHATTLVLDLYDQWTNLEKTGQYRFTPPIHVIVAFHQALREFADEGGVEGRGRRYRENCRILVSGMRELGFRTLLPDHLQAPIIVTFHMPTDPRFEFQRFYDGLKDRGYVICPGKLTVADSFRIGCIGRLYPDDMKGALAAVREVLDEMRVRNGGPALAAEEGGTWHLIRSTPPTRIRASPKSPSTAAATGCPSGRPSWSASMARSRAISSVP